MSDSVNFKCALCQGEFETGPDWDADQAERDFKERFPTHKDDAPAARAAICETCFGVLMAIIAHDKPAEDRLN